jgi:hypothetical protein
MEIREGNLANNSAEFKAYIEEMESAELSGFEPRDDAVSPLQNGERRFGEMDKLRLKLLHHPEQWLWTQGNQDLAISRGFTTKENQIRLTKERREYRAAQNEERNRTDLLYDGTNYTVIMKVRDRRINDAVREHKRLTDNLERSQGRAAVASAGEKEAADLKVTVDAGLVDKHKIDSIAMFKKWYPDEDIDITTGEY